MTSLEYMQKLRSKTEIAIKNAKAKQGTTVEEIANLYAQIQVQNEIIALIEANVPKKDITERLVPICRICGANVQPKYNHNGIRHQLTCPICKTKFVSNEFDGLINSWNGDRNVD